MYEAPRELCSTSRIYGRVVVLMVLVGVGVAAPLAAPVGVDVDAPLVVLLEGTVVLAVAEGVAADES